MTSTPLPWLLALVQVWNSNPCTGVVALFNIQGASFSRALRRFHTHDTSPAALPAVVSPADVPTLRGTAELFAVYSDARKVGGEQLSLVSVQAWTWVVAGRARGLLEPKPWLPTLATSGRNVRSTHFAPTFVEGGKQHKGWRYS